MSDQPPINRGRSGHPTDIPPHLLTQLDTHRVTRGDTKSLPFRPPTREPGALAKKYGTYPGGPNDKKTPKRSTSVPLKSPDPNPKFDRQMRKTRKNLRMVAAAARQRSKAPGDKLSAHTASDVANKPGDMQENTKAKKEEVGAKAKAKAKGKMNPPCAQTQNVK